MKSLFFVSSDLIWSFGRVKRVKMMKEFLLRFQNIKVGYLFSFFFFYFLLI